MAVTPEPIASNRISPEHTIGLLTTSDFVDELHEQLASARHRIVLQLMTFDGDCAGLAVAQRLLDAVARGVRVRVLVDSFALRFVSDRPVGDPEVRDEHAATMAMYRRLADGGVELRFTNANGPGRIFSLARNHKKLYVIDDVAYVGGINVSDHNFEWHDFMVRITDPEVGAALLADLADTFAGRYITLDRHITVDRHIDGVGSAVTLVTNDALRSTFDRMVGGANKRVVVASPYALDRRLLSVLDRSPALDKTVVIADHNNFKSLNAITPFLTARASRAGVELLTYERFSHSKYLLVDDELLIGSSNFGQHSLTCNQEVGLVIRDRDFIAEFESVLLTGLVPAKTTGSAGLRAFGRVATLAMAGYLSAYARIVAPRVRLLARPPRR
jgi:cardiolipin synthase